MKKWKEKIGKWFGNKSAAQPKPVWEEMTLRLETEDLDTLREKIVIAAMNYLKRKDYTEVADRMNLVSAALYEDVNFLCMVQAPFDRDTVYETSNLTDEERYNLKVRTL